MAFRTLFMELFIQLGYTPAQAATLEEMLDVMGPEGGQSEDIAAQILKYGEGAVKEIRRLHGKQETDTPEQAWLFPTVVAVDPRTRNR